MSKFTLGVLLFISTSALGMSLPGAYALKHCKEAVRTGLAAEDIDVAVTELYLRCQKVQNKDPECYTLLPDYAKTSIETHERFLQEAAKCVTRERPAYREVRSAKETTESTL